MKCRVYNSYEIMGDTVSSGRYYYGYDVLSILCIVRYEKIYYKFRFLDKTAFDMNDFSFFCSYNSYFWYWFGFIFGVVVERVFNTLTNIFSCLLYKKLFSAVSKR